MLSTVSFGLNGTIVYFGKRSHFDYIVREKFRHRAEVMEFAVPYGKAGSHHHVHYAIDYPNHLVLVFDEKNAKKATQFKKSKRSKQWMLQQVREELQSLGSFQRAKTVSEKKKLAKRYLSIHALKEFDNAKDLKSLVEG